jgi:hypothetical protein
MSIAKIVNTTNYVSNSSSERSTFNCSFATDCVRFNLHLPRPHGFQEFSFLERYWWNYIHTVQCQNVVHDEKIIRLFFMICRCLIRKKDNGFLLFASYYPKINDVTSSEFLYSCSWLDNWFVLKYAVAEGQTWILNNFAHCIYLRWHFPKKFIKESLSAVASV